MSAGAEDSSGRHAHSGTGLAPSAAGEPGALAGANDLPDDPASPERSSTSATPGPTQSSAAPSSSELPAAAAKAASQPHHHHVLIAASEDRWAWRRRIRQNPHQLRLYRVGVAVAGLLLICLGVVSGPLPGPGGIPLVLLGLATWSSEFEWAYRLRLRFMAEIRRMREWSVGKKVAFWAAFFAVCGSFGYCYLLVLGVPFWVPDVGANLFQHLPGVKAR